MEATFKEFMEANLEDHIEIIAKKGAAIGTIPHLTTHHEANKLYDEYESEIWEELSEDADDMGHGVLEHILEFKGADEVTDLLDFKTFLVRQHAEGIAQDIMEDEENDEDDD